MKRRTVFSTIFLLLPLLPHFRAFPPGAEFLRDPGRGFFSGALHQFVLTGDMPAEPGDSGLKELSALLDEEDYASAEKLLLKDRDGRNLLNLFLLYLYLGENREAALVFPAATKELAGAAMFRLADVFHRAGNRLALQFLADHAGDAASAYYTLFRLSLLQPRPAYTHAILRHWLAEKSVPDREKFLVEARLEASRLYQEHVLRTYPGWEKEEFALLLQGMDLLQAGQDEKAFRLWFARAKTNTGVSRDMYSRVVRLMIRLKHWDLLDEYLENPPLFLQENAGEWKELAKREKEKNKFRSNVLEFEVIEKQETEAERLERVNARKTLPGGGNTKP